MDNRLLHHYNRELAHLRKGAEEFAREFPLVAKRLELEGGVCPDPYVERLLEGFAYLTARIQVKLDAEFPRFTQHLLEAVYPHFLAPTPSMCIVQFIPDASDAALAAGLRVPKGSTLKSVLGRGDHTACQYRTAHETTLYPLRLTEVQYYTREVGTLELPRALGARGPIKSALRVKIEVGAGLAAGEIKISELPFFLSGSDQSPMRLHELIMAHTAGIVVRATGKPSAWESLLDREVIQPLGYDDEHSLLPLTPRGFHGYRLLQEYFTLPQRFLFVNLRGLDRALAERAEREFEIILAFDDEDRKLEGMIDRENVAIFCSPAINLFERRADRINVTDKEFEFHVVPDRARPLDYEVYDILGVEGFGAQGDAQQRFKPFYAANDFSDVAGEAYFSVVRRSRVLSEKEQRQVGKTQSLTYKGSEVFLSIVDSSHAPYRSDLRQLGVETLCTNRHLPQFMPVGERAGRTDFTTELGAAVKEVRVISGPTEPKSSAAEGEVAWRLISHLTLNYLSLADSADGAGASALRDLLRLYADATDLASRRQIEGVRSVSCAPITRRVPTPGPIAFARGLEVHLTLSDTLFEGRGIFILGSVLERFFAKYVSINSFTETVLRSEERGLVHRWKPRLGQRAIV
ncbi:MAG: type VI secretion system baseplate subunit TssF [Phycisphaeraceae bacterium]|nr:type VI secretion system baseplate subunit TssF [Phycisphaeraceae bacterium]